MNLLPLWLVFAIWITYGLQDLFELLDDRRKLEAAFAILLFAGLMIRIPISLPHVDASQDVRARDFIDSTSNNIPKDSLVFIEGDEQIFSLWYAQFALHQRTDLVLVASDLLPYKWYMESLNHTYPNANIPIMDILLPVQLTAANPERVVCYISADSLPECK